MAIEEAKPNPVVAILMMIVVLLLGPCAIIEAMKKHDKVNNVLCPRVDEEMAYLVYYVYNFVAILVCMILFLFFCSVNK
jgi:hypothetical protein